MRQLAALVAGLLIAVPAWGQERFSFGVIGDAPYNDFEALPFSATLEALGRAPLAFVIHVGDIKGGFSSCSDAVLAQRRGLLDASPLPLFYTPGDNEWVDCGRELAGGFDPLERLAALRGLFFAGNQSLGRRRLPVERQSGFPENARWQHGGVVFITLNMPGSANNAAMPDEQRTRMAANFAWLAQAVELASRAPLLGLVVIAHADPNFGAMRRADGYVAYRAVLAAQARRLGKPMLLIHGDGHIFRHDRPLRGAPNFMRLATFGSPIVSSAIVTVEPGLPALFEIAPGPPGR